MRYGIPSPWDDVPDTPADPKRLVECDGCDGKGVAATPPTWESKTCERCNGAGEVLEGAPPPKADEKPAVVFEWAPPEFDEPPAMPRYIIDIAQTALVTAGAHSLAADGTLRELIAGVLELFDHTGRFKVDYLSGNQIGLTRKS